MRISGDRKTTAANSFKQFGRFFSRRYAQFLFQRLHTDLVLAHGSGLVIGLGVELHQRSVRWLVQRIQSQPAPGIRDGFLILAGLTVQHQQALQCTCKRQSQLFRLEQLPVVEVRATLQAETCQKTVLVERNGRFQRDPARFTNFGGFVAMPITDRQVCLESDNINP